MRGINENLLARIQKLEREVERLQVKESPGAWKAWTPTLVGWSSTTILACKYLKIGKILFFTAIIQGTSNSTSTSFTLPETAILTQYSGTMGYCENNGTALTVAARYGIAHGSNICKAYTNMEAGAWTASGTKMISVFGRIAIN